MSVYGMPIYSRAVTFTTGGAPISIPLDFLDQVLCSMQAPMIDELVIRVTGTMTTAATTGGARAELFPQLFTRVELSDVLGPLISLSGASLRILQQVEWGERYSDVTINRVGNLGAGASTTVTLALRIPCRPSHAQYPEEYRRSAHLLRGGLLSVTPNSVPFGGATVANQVATYASATISCYALVVDEIVPTEKMRYQIREWPVNSLDDNYSGAKGRLRYAGFYIGPTQQDVSAGAVAFASQNLTSRTLGYAVVTDDFLIDVYKSRNLLRTQDAAQGVVIEDEALRGLHIPLVQPRLRQSVLQMPALDGGFHLLSSLTTIPAGPPVVILGWLAERPAGQAICGADAGGRPKYGSLGAVLGGNGKKYDPATLPDPRLANILPREIIPG